MSGIFMVSLDFELFWGMLDVCPLDGYKENVLGGREAIPKLLNLFETYGIHATWATVGYLFAESREELFAQLPPKHLRPTYENQAQDPYAWLDAMEVSEAQSPCFFAPGLLKQISAVPGQEIGSHTFCHFYCQERGQTPEQFAADMAAARAMGKCHGYDLRSVVLPRNQCAPEYLAVLKELGYTAYRDQENDWVHRKVPVRIVRRALTLLDAYLPLTAGTCIPKPEQGIWNFTGTKMYRPIMKPLRFLEGWKLRRIKGQMRRAAKRGEMYHLWWHPHNLGRDTQAHLDQLEALFQYYQELNRKYGMISLNMGEAAQRL